MGNDILSNEASQARTKASSSTASDPRVEDSVPRVAPRAHGFCARNPNRPPGGARRGDSNGRSGLHRAWRAFDRATWRSYRVFETLGAAFFMFSIAAIVILLVVAVMVKAL